MALASRSEVQSSPVAVRWPEVSIAVRALATHATANSFEVNRRFCDAGYRPSQEA